MCYQLCRCKQRCVGSSSGALAGSVDTGVVSAVPAWCRQRQRGVCSGSVGTGVVSALPAGCRQRQRGVGSGSGGWLAASAAAAGRWLAASAAAGGRAGRRWLAVRACGHIVVGEWRGRHMRAGAVRRRRQACARCGLVSRRRRRVPSRAVLVRRPAGVALRYAPPTGRASPASRRPARVPAWCRAAAAVPPVSAPSLAAARRRAPRCKLGNVVCLALGSRKAEN